MDRNKLKSALKQISEFITTLEASAEKSEDVNLQLFFSVKDEGTIALRGEDANSYQDGLKSLIMAVDSELISTKAVENLYQQTILNVLDIYENRRDKSFDQRLKIALENLEKSLSAPSTTFGIYFPIGGLSEDGLPIQIGKVSFCTFDNDHLENFKEIVRKYEGDDPNESVRREYLIGEIQKSEIVGKPVGLVEVKSIDTEAGKAQALKELSLTLDIINFYSDLIPYQKGYLYLPGERERVTINIPVFSQDNKFVHAFGWEAAGPLMPVSLRLLFETDKKHGLGFLKVLEMLRRKRNDLENRLIAAMQWAGRATAEIRKEEAFLLYAISLESLILLDNEREELSYRLRTRIAHLLGIDTGGRLEISKKVGELYSTRSKIVHRGWFQVTDADLGLMRFYAKMSVLRILVEEPFNYMKNSSELVRWFNYQIMK
jgi:hypothetical protein